MVGFKQILCAVDKSEYSQRALQYAVALKQAAWAELTVLTVRPLLLPAALWMEYPVAPSLSPMDPEDEEARMRAFIHDTVGAALAKVMVREGVIAPEILRAAHDLPADLIVMGTHGSSGFEHWLVGSVAENVLRHAACPVLTVPRGAADPPDSLTAPFKTILCAIDFSRDSERALELARSLAAAAGGRLVLVHVLEQFSRENPTLTAHFNVAEFRRTLERDAQQRLENLAAPRARQQWHMSGVVAHGKASREVLRVAAACGADLIVLGVHGRNAIDLALFGSTTRQVLHRATMPVLTVPRDMKDAASASSARTGNQLRGFDTSWIDSGRHRTSYAPQSGGTRSAAVE
jgi:nucleotide-binding universal stress UspA family protein